MAYDILKPTQLKSLPPGKHRDGPNLYLQVKRNGDGSAGSRLWIFRYLPRDRMATTSREMSLGRLQDVSLHEAREAARYYRNALSLGKDPKEMKDAAKEANRSKNVAGATTLQKCLKEFVTDAAEQKAWDSQFKLHVYPHTKQWPVAMIDDAIVESILKPIWQEKTATAKLIRRRLADVLDYATKQKYRTGANPARWEGHLAITFKKTNGKKKKNHPSLPHEQMKEFMAWLNTKQTATAYAIKFMIFTAARPVEAAQATWSEIDIENKLWTLPAERMKTRKVHKVPLSAPAVALLKLMQKARISAYVFPGMKEDQGLNAGSLLNWLQGEHKQRAKAGLDAFIDPKLEKLVVPHGFRSSFKSWATDETVYPDILSEMALSHKVGDDVYNAYMRAEAIEKRRALMTDYSKYIGA